MNENSKLRRRLALLAIGLVLQVAYILFPLDLFPDFVPVLGWIDDLVAAGGVMSTLVLIVQMLRNGGAEALLEMMPQQGMPEVDADYEPIPADVLRKL